MKLVFCGTPEFAVPTLSALLNEGHEISLVLTQPDRPAGRKMELHAPPVKLLAQSHGLSVLQPERIKKNEELRELLELIQPDAIIVVAYGRIIPQWMLDLPRFGNINLHGSLLPKYRGAAPVQWAIANGETETGVTTMHLDVGLDTGDILLERRVPLDADETAETLFPKLALLGAELVIETLAGLGQGTVQRKPQNHEEATLAPILTREDGRLDLLNFTSRQAYNRWRGFYPWPGAHASFREKRFLVHRMHPVLEGPALAPGDLDWNTNELLVGAADRTLLALDEVQLEGKARLPGMGFVRDFQLKAGERLG
ncbi:MAG TPA: methionyl-tRNA formyltransferase [Acidobacteriaceae bacterium]|jgi:methionyl-tRNA formyltransferase